MMRFVDLILKKKDGLELTKDEIQMWMDGYIKDEIPDYQVSALLMAILLKGMSHREISDLTLAMMNSGELIDLSDIKGIKVDKHSTGGVGDKTSLALGPMVAACGVKMAKMSGRGLGHTGGTLDKLESIEGFNCFLTREEFVRQVNDIGIAIIGQTGNIVPADKKLYALRDVTGTVNSLPLIASSIMSKKLAAGTDAIMLDVKYGNGAFMQTPEEAVELAEVMISIGNSMKRKTKAMITDMEAPLGNAIGNALEVREAIDTLHGEGPKDFTELCMQSGSHLLLEAGVVKTEEEGREMLKEAVESGQAFEKFRQMVIAQGGNVNVVDHPQQLPQAKFVTGLKSKKTGYVKRLKALELGTLAMKIGAGRERKEDGINFAVGIVLNRKVSDAVEVGDVLAYVHHDLPLDDQWLDGFYESFEIVADKIEPQPLVYAVL